MLVWILKDLLVTFHAVGNTVIINNTSGVTGSHPRSGYHSSSTANCSARIRVRRSCSCFLSPAEEAQLLEAREAFDRGEKLPPKDGDLVDRLWKDGKATAELVNDLVQGRTLEKGILAKDVQAEAQQAMDELKKLIIDNVTRDSGVL